MSEPKVYKVPLNLYIRAFCPDAARLAAMRASFVMIDAYHNQTWSGDRSSALIPTTPDIEVYPVSKIEHVAAQKYDSTSKVEELENIVDEIISSRTDDDETDIE